MASITLKNIPDPLYALLKSRAKLHHRSINSEAIRCLERVLQPEQLTASERLQRIRALRPGEDRGVLDPGELEEAIMRGRP